MNYPQITGEPNFILIGISAVFGLLVIIIVYYIVVSKSSTPGRLYPTVASASMAPSPPVVINTIEAKINNNLIIVKPMEVQKAVKEQGKTKQEKEAEELEAEAARRLAQMVKEASEKNEKKVILTETYANGQAGCNPAISVCVKWENPDAPDIQSKGRGIAYRNTDPDHYAEVKTTGYSSNTNLTITQNDSVATALIGDGSPGGNNVTIKQNLGVVRK